MPINIGPRSKNFENLLTQANYFFHLLLLKSKYSELSRRELLSDTHII